MAQSLGSLNRSIQTSKRGQLQPEGRVGVLNSLYVGFIKKNADPLRHGRVWVFIPELGGHPNQEENWLAVQYTSPFAGATDKTKLEKNSQDWQKSQQSYGFWMTPPDLENQVLVGFVNGDPNRGYVIGFLFDQFMNHMVPGIGTAESFTQGEMGVENPPVVEYNKWQDQVLATEPPPKRPRYEPLHEGLRWQGLYADPQRGPSTSSARRESPSKAYGIKFPKGSHMVFDEQEENEFIRFRTRNGNQLFMHVNEGYVYVNSAKGNAYLELNDEGVFVYSAEGIHVRSQRDFNLHVDRDINVHCGRNFNLFVKRQMEHTVGKNYKIKVGKLMQTTVAKDYKLRVCNEFWQEVKNNINIRTKKEFCLLADEAINHTSLKQIIDFAPKIYHNTKKGTAPTPANMEKMLEPQPVTDRELDVDAQYPETQTTTICKRLVHHEPFKRRIDDHENEPVDDEIIEIDEEDTDVDYLAQADCSFDDSSNGGSQTSNSSGNDSDTPDDPGDSSEDGGASDDEDDSNYDGDLVFEDEIDESEDANNSDDVSSNTSNQTERKNTKWTTSPSVFTQFGSNNNGNQTPLIPRNSGLSPFSTDRRRWQASNRQSISPPPPTLTTSNSNTTRFSSQSRSPDKMPSYMRGVFGIDTSSKKALGDVRYVTIHCSETKPSQDIGLSELILHNLSNGHFGVAHHFIIRRDGTREVGESLRYQCNHVANNNSGNISVCLVGGRDIDGSPENNFTRPQAEALTTLLRELKQRYPTLTNDNIKGHDEWDAHYGDENYTRRPCPNFNVRRFVRRYLL